MNTATLSPLTRIRATLDHLAGPQSGLCALILLIARAYLFYVFFRSGLTKLHDWPTTVLLFSEEYKVPLLPPRWPPPSAPSANWCSRRCC